MPLYPSGFSGINNRRVSYFSRNGAGEVICMWKALPTAKKYSIDLPNPHNLALSLHLAISITLAVYAMGLFVMYGHMNAQRKRAYAKKATKND
jgi:hypothetical protein